jgi:transposase
VSASDTVDEQPNAAQAKVDALVAANAKLVAERDEYRKLYLSMLEICRKLELGILGQKREKVAAAPGQMSLAVLGTLLSEEARGAAPAPPAELETVREHTRQKPTGRKPLPEKLPRVEIEVLPPEVQQEGLAAFEKIGEDVAETVERRPASLVVVRTHRPKFVRKDRERLAETEVLQGEAIELPIARGIAGPGLLADTVVRRWYEHMPLHRLERSYGREGLPLARSTMCGWHADLAALVKPLLKAMHEDALMAPYLCTDATGVLVQAKDRCGHGHFWVLIAPERHVLFEYTAKHDGAAVDTFLAGYKGHLVADAHAVFDHLYRKGDVVEVGCWSHARRYFFKALETDPDRARHALALIAGIFVIERKLAQAPPETKLKVRQTETKPIVDAFFAWCDREAALVLDETPIAKGIGYARNQRVALGRFLGDGRLPAHNNWSERELRREAVGRKNWLFIGNDDAGEVNATFVSLIASCQLHGLEPWAYLRDLFCLLPAWPQRRVLDLSPAFWKKTLEEKDTQQLLATNVFRRVVLDLPVDHPSTK